MSPPRHTLWLLPMALLGAACPSPSPVRTPASRRPPSRLTPTGASPQGAPREPSLAHIVPLPAPTATLSWTCPPGEHRVAACVLDHRRKTGFLVCAEPTTSDARLRARVVLSDHRFELRAQDGRNAAFHLDYGPGTHGYELWLRFRAAGYLYAIGDRPGPRIPCGKGPKCPADSFFGLVRKPVESQGSSRAQRFPCQSMIRILYDLVARRRNRTLSVPGADR